MEKKARAAKKKGVLIRDLGKVTLAELDPDQMHVITGGTLYTCGSSSADCERLEVYVSAAKFLTVSITKKKAALKVMG